MNVFVVVDDSYFAFLVYFNYTTVHRQCVLCVWGNERLYDEVVGGKKKRICRNTLAMTHGYERVVCWYSKLNVCISDIRPALQQNETGALDYQRKSSCLRS